MDNHYYFSKPIEIVTTILPIDHIFFYLKKYYLAECIHLLNMMDPPKMLMIKA